MSLATGGRAIGATSTRSSSASRASCKAISIFTIPTCSPAGPTSRTSGTRMRSLIRGSVLICPPCVVNGNPVPAPTIDLRTSPKSRTGHRSSRRPVKTTERRHTGRPPPQTDPAINTVLSLRWEIGSPLADPVRHRIGQPERYHLSVLFPGLPLPVRGRNCPAELVRLRLDQPVTGCQLVKHDALNGQRLRSRWVDQESRGTLGQRCLRSDVQSYRNRAGTFLPGFQRIETCKGQHGSSTVSTLQQNDRHLRLLVGDERARRPPDPRGGGDDRDQKSIAAQRRHGSQVGVRIALTTERRQQLAGLPAGLAVIAGEG